MNRTPRSPLRSIFLVAAIAAALPVACTAQPPANPIAQPPAATPAPPLVSGLPDFTNLVQRVGPAVVNIRAEVTPRRTARGQMPDEEQIPEIFRRFFGDELPFPGGPGGPGPRGPGAPSWPDSSTSTTAICARWAMPPSRAAARCRRWC